MDSLDGIYHERFMKFRSFVDINTRKNIAENIIDTAQKITKVSHGENWSIWEKWYTMTKQNKEWDKSFLRLNGCWHG